MCIPSVIHTPRALGGKGARTAVLGLRHNSSNTPFRPLSQLLVECSSPTDQGNAVNRSARSVAFAASPRTGPTPKISSTDRNVELWVYRGAAVVHVAASGVDELMRRLGLWLR
jgi:hypothetical protein